MLHVALLGPLIRRATGRKLRVLIVRPKLEDMVHITELVEAGKVIPAIDRRYPLREVPEALRYLGEGRAHGKVVITM
jgi:NADPH:quinone reductase-like Zn-dependent oxidoreductase